MPISQILDFSSHSSLPRSSIEMSSTVDYLLTTSDKSVLVPLSTFTALPSRATDIAELSTTDTPTYFILVYVHESEPDYARHMIAPKIEFDQSTTLNAPLPSVGLG